MYISAIIVTRNTCALTLAAVRSVFETRDLPTVEVVVVDNGSHDGTADAVHRECPGVKLIRSERNLGFAKANNLGVSSTKGEFLLLLNSDARLKSDTLPLALTWMRQHPDCGIIGAQLLNADGSFQNSIANFPSLATELLNKSLLRRLFPRRFPGKERISSGPIEVETVIGAFMLIRRIVWNQVAGLDERFFFFFEETDFCLQALRKGWKTFHLPLAQVWHEQGRSAGQAASGARVEYWRSRYAYFAKNSAFLTRLILRIGLFVRLLVDWLASALACLLTLGRSVRWRAKWKVNLALLQWHLRGCSSDAGLPR